MQVKVLVLVMAALEAVAETILEALMVQAQELLVKVMMVVHTELLVLVEAVELAQ